MNRETLVVLSISAGLCLMALFPRPADAQSVPSRLEYGIPDGEHAEYPLHLGFFGGAANVAEQHVGQTGVGRGAFTATYRPFHRLAIDARYTGNFAERPYLARGPDLEQPVQSRRVEEFQWDTSLNVGYEVFGDRHLEGALALKPYLGLRLFGFVSDAFPRWAGAPQIGFVFGHRATDRLTLEASADAGYVGFGRTTSHDLLGAPTVVSSYQISSLFQFGERFFFRLAATGQTLWREHASRQSFGALGGLEVRLF